MIKMLVRKAFQTLGLRIMRTSTFERVSEREIRLRHERDGLRRELEILKRGKADPIRVVVEHNLVFQELYRLTAQVRILESEKTSLERRLAALPQSHQPEAGKAA